MVRHSLVAAVAAAALFAAADRSYGAAAGKTSNTTCSTNPAQRAIQMQLDPLGVTDFQLTMSFDPQKVSVASEPIFVGDGQEIDPVVALNGYVLGVRGSEAQAIAIDPVHGLITVRGYYPDAANVPDIEADVFAVNFILTGHVDGDTSPLLPLGTPLEFESLGLNSDTSLFGPNSPDFMRDNSTTYFAPNITSSSSGTVFIPEPAGMVALLPAGLLLARRNRR